MAARKRGQIISTGAMTALKVKLNSAIKGHHLLKTKGDALALRFRSILENYCEIKLDLNDLLEQAWFILVEAKYVWDGFPQLILEGATEAKIKVEYDEECIVGVTLRNFKVAVLEGEPYPLVGLGRGGAEIKAVKGIFRDLTHLAVDLATLQAAFMELNEAISTTKRRVNALEHVVIPCIEEDIRTITQVMEEEDREQFFRMKKIQELRTKAAQNLQQSMPGGKRRRRARSREKRSREDSEKPVREDSSDNQP